MNSDHRPILINIPTELLHKLDEAAQHLDLSRSELVRRSLHRDIKFVVKHEVEEASRAKAKTNALYDDWIQRV